MILRLLYQFRIFQVISSGTLQTNLTLRLCITRQEKLQVELNLLSDFDAYNARLLT